MHCLSPLQVILNKGAIGHHMYFVQMGVVEILPDENAPPVAVFKEGDIFGEVGRIRFFNSPLFCLPLPRGTWCTVLPLVLW